MLQCRTEALRVSGGDGRTRNKEYGDAEDDNCWGDKGDNEEDSRGDFLVLYIRERNRGIGEGERAMVGGDFPEAGADACDGTSLPISENYVDWSIEVTLQYYDPVKNVRCDQALGRPAQNCTGRRCTRNHAKSLAVFTEGRIAVKCAERKCDESTTDFWM